MQSFFADAAIRLNQTLFKIIHGWVRDGVPLEDVEFACGEAARYGSHRFAYVEKVVNNRVAQRHAAAAPTASSAAKGRVVFFDSYRAAHGG